MKKIIFIVDDEPDILKLIEINLKLAGFEFESFETPSSFLERLKIKIPDLIVLDIMLPEIDGFELCKMIRVSEKYKNIPIIMLTARSDVLDRVLGLEFGADDYMVKPFSPRELMARIKSVLRRTEANKTNQERIRKIEENFFINLDKYEVTIDNKIIALTTTEFKILELLSERRGWVYSRNQILNYLWGNEKIVVDRTIDVHIRNLRKKLGAYGNLLKNIRGIGYKLN